MASSSKTSLMSAERALEFIYQTGSDDDSEVDHYSEIDDDNESSDDSDIRYDITDRSRSREDDNSDSTSVSESESENESRPESRSSGTNAVGNETPDLDLDLVLNHDLDIDRGDEYDIETDIDEDGDPDEWIRNTVNFPKIPEFSGNSGLKFDVGDDPTPYEIYSLFITDELISDWKREINRYARSAIDEKKRVEERLSPRSKFIQWKPVTLDEVRLFIAICTHMGILYKSHLHDYWSIDPSVHSSFCGKVMDRDRFMAILGFFHVANNETFIPYGEENHDPIHKIRPFLMHLNERFKALYVPKKKVCVDEAMCPFKGRSRFKVYMKDKPVKWGFKFYELCESGSGYVVSLEMFCADKRFSNKPTDVVLRLMQPFFYKGYQLYIDNYYCCPDLVQKLLEKETMTCGTVRKNRVGMPKDLATQRVPKGQLDYRRKGQIIAAKWVDKREVYTLSTMSKPQLREIQARYELKQKPLAVIDYIKNMSGVDHSDQLISYFPMRRKSLKWWKKPFFHLLTLVMVLSSILLNKYRKEKGLKPITLHNVVKKVINSLANAPPVEAAAEGPRLDFERLTGKHFASYLHKDPERKTTAYRNCKVCYD